MKKIVIGTPHKNNFTPGFVASLPIMLLGLRDFYVEIILRECGILSNERNLIFKAAQEMNADYLLFIDTDTEFPADGLAKLLKLDKDVATGVYFQRVFPFRPVVYKFAPSGKVINFSQVPQEPFKVDAAGCGFMLIGKRVLDAFTDEYEKVAGLPFNILTSPNDMRVQLSEDVSFCHRLKFLGFDIWADPSIKLGHEGKKTVTEEDFSEAVKTLTEPLDAVAEGIEGWTTDEELAWLAEQARGMESIAELGSHKGRSSDVLLKNCCGQVHCIDLWDGKTEFSDSERIKVWDGDEILSEFRKNVGHYPNLVAHRGDTAEIAKKMNGSKFDMVFIDADHSYEGCKRDIEAWLPRTKKLICGHDYCNEWPGVVKAVKEKFGEVKTVGTIWYVPLEGRS